MVINDIFNRDPNSVLKTFLIAEVGQAHDGSLGMAHAYIDAAAEAGADAIKFQTHIAEEESTYDEQFRVAFSKQDLTRYEYWKRMEFTSEQWNGLSQHAEDVGLVFLSSAFSLAAVELLDEIGMPAWKVGSGEYQSQELLDRMLTTGKPILLSTGMSRWDEIHDFVEHMVSHQHKFALLQCTSQYPTESKDVGLNVLDEYRTRYSCPIGLSDHSGKVFASLSAMAKGVDIIEVHITFDKRAFGPDTSSSLTLEEFSLLAKARDEFFLMSTYPVDKDTKALELSEMRKLFTKSIAPSRLLNAGEILTDDMLMPKKPGTGISYADRHKVIGCKLLKTVSPDRLLRLDDIEVTNA